MSTSADIQELISRGTETLSGFSFDLGTINDLIYGTASNLRGEVRFAFPPGTCYTTPAILKDPEIRHKCALEVLPHVRDAFSAYLDEEIIEILKDYAFLGCGFPGEMPEYRLKFLMAGCGYAWCQDDLMDSGESWFSYESFNEYWNSIDYKKSPYELYDNIPNLHSAVDALKRMGRYSVDLIVNHDLHYRDTYFKPELFEAVRLTTQANIALLEFKKDGSKYSRSFMMETFREVSGNRIPLEITDIVLDKGIRSDFLFARAMNSYLELNMLYNAIFGLKKDIRKREEDSPIFYLIRYEGKSLQEAFDIVYECMNNSFNDYVLTLEKLCKVYAGNEMLMKYLYHMSYIIAGSALGYKLMDRYGVQNCIKCIYKD